MNSVPESQPLPPIEMTEEASPLLFLDGSTWREAEPDPARALLAEMVDAFYRVFKSQVSVHGPLLTADQRGLLDDAWEVSIKARKLLGAPCRVDSSQE